MPNYYPMTNYSPAKGITLSRIDELDGLRGILALWVAVSHIFCWCGFSRLPFVLPHWMNSVADRFWVQFSFAGGAVEVFIILSGFVISYLLHARPQTYRQFLTGRFFRIFPVYLLCLLAGLASIYLMTSVLASVSWHDDEYFRLYVRPTLDSGLARPLTHLCCHLSMLFGAIPENILRDTSATLLAPAWSISLEWQYYLLAPFLAWYARRPPGLFLLGLICSGEWVYAHFWGAAFLPRYLPLFLIGIGSFHLYANADKLKAFRLRRHVFAGVAAAVLILQWRWLALLIWLVVLGGMLADGSHPTERYLLGPRRFLLRPALDFIGRISYPLYLVHWPVIIFLMAGLVAWQPDISPGAALTVMLMGGVPVILACSWLLHVWVEKPLMQFGKKITR